MRKKFVFVVTMAEREWFLNSSSHSTSWRWVRLINQALELRESLLEGDDLNFMKAIAERGAHRGLTRMTWPLSITDFEKCNMIGHGSFGTVYLAKYSPTGEYYAVKELDKKESSLYRVLNEIEVLEYVDYPFVSKMHCHFETTQNYLLVMDYIEGGELAHYLEREGSFNEDTTRFYAAEILLGIKYLHTRGVLYRDLKTQNVLLDSEGHAILIDFGLSKVLGDSKTDSVCGTPSYLSPEVWLKKDYSLEIDWWAFGILVYEMLTGDPPFEFCQGEDARTFGLLISVEEIYYPSYVSDDAVDLIESLTRRNMEDRLTDPSDIQKHPFFSSIDWDQLEMKKVKPPLRPLAEERETHSFHS
jgi:serine/threonine protein kinase